MTKTIWRIICLGAGIICGVWGAKYFELRYENELMTNFLLRQEIKEYKNAKGTISSL